MAIVIMVVVIIEKKHGYISSKTKSLFLDQFTEVSYIKSSSGFNKSEEFQVTNILPLTHYKIIDSSNKSLLGKEKNVMMVYTTSIWSGI